MFEDWPVSPVPQRPVLWLAFGGLGDWLNEQKFASPNGIVAMRRHLANCTIGRHILVRVRRYNAVVVGQARLASSKRFRNHKSWGSATPKLTPNSPWKPPSLRELERTALSRDSLIFLGLMGFRNLLQKST